MGSERLNKIILYYVYILLAGKSEVLIEKYPSYVIATGT